MFATVFTISIDPEAVPPEFISPLIDALQNFQPVLQQIGSVMSKYQVQNFEDEGATFGAPWEPLKDSTFEQKRRQGWPLKALYRTGHLFEELGQVLEITSDTITVGENMADFDVPYPEFQNRHRIIMGMAPGEIVDMENVVKSWLAGIQGLPIGAVTIEEATA